MSQQLPPPQRVSLSRRPIKATEPFGSAVGGGNSGKPSSLWSQGSPLPVATPTGGKKGASDRRGSPVSGALHSPKDSKLPPKVPGRGTPSPVTMVAGGVNPRRANSLNSLNDQDYYMNSMWPKAVEKATSPSSQMEDHTVGPPEQQGVDPTPEPRGGTKSHRRSNSYTYTTLEHSSSQPRKIIPLGASGNSRLSTESLEMSNFFDGEEDFKKQLMENTESGRMAPVTELMSTLSMGSQQLTPIPMDTPSTPPTSTPSSPLVLCSNVKTSPIQKALASQSPGLREDSPESSYFTQKYPPSPKPTFQREPPDGADKLVVKPPEPLLSLDERNIQAPDASKVQIQFTPGGVFKPAAE